MNTKDLISVIIPSYNRFEYLQNAVESVMSQTYRNFEIIVVNDGSTQEEYYENIFPKPVKIINLETNQKNILGYVSEGHIRNFGIEAAEGSYVAFLDDDDIWLPRKLELQLSAMKETDLKFSSTEGYFGEGIYKDSEKYELYNKEKFFKKISKKYKGTKYRSIFSSSFVYPKIWNYDFLKHHNCVIASSTMVEKKLMNILGGFRGIPTSMAPDYDCWLGLLRLTDLVYVDEPLFYYDGAHGSGQLWK